MTKEEIIREAYGEYWQKDIDKDGWLSYASFPEYFLRKKELLEFKGETQSNCFVRPKSLQGIENNNGWIKIESEADLPSVSNSLEYFVFHEGVIRYSVWDNYLKKFGLGSYNFIPTHYQPIVKPKNPIY